MKKENCLIINAIHGYIGKFLIKSGYNVRSPWKNDHFSTRKYKLLSLIDKQYLLYGFTRNEVEKYENILVFETDKVSKILEDIRKWNPKANIRLMMWNIVRPYFIEEINRAKLLNVKIYSFDRDDCNKYNLNYSDIIYPYYNSYGISSEQNIKYDCYCCMANKGRMIRLLQIKDILDKNDCKYLFQLLPDKKEKNMEYKDINVLRKQIDYKQYLDNLSESKCVIEILQDGQCGVTWRTFESLFYNKKLITSNQRIVDYDFYNPNNILVLGDNLDKIKEFLDKPYIPVDENIKSKYMCENIIKKLFE